MSEARKKNILVGIYPEDKKHLEQASYRLAALWELEEVPKTVVIRTAIEHLNKTLKSLNIECQ